MYYGLLRFATRVSPPGRRHEVLVGHARPDLKLNNVPKATRIHRVWTDFRGPDGTFLHGIALHEKSGWHIELLTDRHGSSMAFSTPLSTRKALATSIEARLLENRSDSQRTTSPQPMEDPRGANGDDTTKTTYCSVDLLTCGSNGAPLTCGHHHRSTAAAERCGKSHQDLPRHAQDARRAAVVSASLARGRLALFRTSRGELL